MKVRLAFLRIVYQYPISRNCKRIQIGYAKDNKLDIEVIRMKKQLQSEIQQEKHLICSEQLFWADLRAIVDDTVEESSKSKSDVVED